MGELEAPDFKLRCQLLGHEEDVRGLCANVDGRIATGSRDKSVRIWTAPEGEIGGYLVTKTLVGHTSFVGPIAWLAPSEDFPEGGLVSGGMDTRVLVWNLETASIVQDLQGHKLQITSVAVDANGDILSASVDSTVRRWRMGKTLEVLHGHKGPVQAVLSLPSGEIVTGSSDTTLKLWKGTTCVHTFSGHSDTVRGLALMPNIGILSASHDGSVRLWAVTGEQLMEMVGHTAIVYSVAAHASGDIASGSEDGFAKIWKGGSCIQSIEHPGCVWDVTFLPNGDLVTACSDGVARVWTRDSQHSASLEELEAYKSLILTRKMQTKTVGGVKVDNLPGLEALQQPGAKDGQTRIVREGDSGVAYSWNAKEYKWDKIGEVVDGPGDSLDKKSLNGVTYDYVFDVDIGDGLPTRKLPYNHGQNPYDVADQWLANEELPAGYREQVVQFILQNTGSTAAPPQFDPAFVDPYTGANAYVPRPPVARNGSSAAYTLRHIPKKGSLLFDTAQYDGIAKKILEFNAAFTSDEQHKTLALSGHEVQRLQVMISMLKELNSPFADVDFNLLTRILLLWPTQYIFPALDILRMMLLHPQCATYFAKDGGDGKDVVMESLRRATSEPMLAANLVTGARVAVNCFKHHALHTWTMDHRSEILDLLAECCKSTNKSARLAYATLVLNYAVSLVESKDDGGQIQVLSAALEMAGPQEQDVEVQFRALVAIGTLIHSGQVKSVALDLDTASLAVNASNSPVAKIAEVGRDLKYLLD
ncbi:unnamed protein product [Sphagnum compactum]